MEIKSQAIIDYLEYSLKKPIELISKFGFLQVKELLLNPINMGGEFSPIIFDEISNFSNLNRLELENLSLSSDNIKVLLGLKMLEDLSFVSCDVDDFGFITKIPNLQVLSIIDCSIANPDILSKIGGIKKLSFVRNNFKSLNFLKNLSLLEDLKLTAIKIKNKLLPENIPIKRLELVNTDIDNIDVLKSYKNLEYLCLNKEIIKADQSLIKELKSNNANLAVEDELHQEV